MTMNEKNQIEVKTVDQDDESTARSRFEALCAHLGTSSALPIPRTVVSEDSVWRCGLCGSDDLWMYLPMWHGGPVDQSGNGDEPYVSDWYDPEGPIGGLQPEFLCNACDRITVAVNRSASTQAPGPGSPQGRAIAIEPMVREQARARAESDLGQVAEDLIVDLMHFVVDNDPEADGDRVLDRARLHFEAEQNGEG